MMQFALKHKLDVHHLPPKGREFSFEATLDECLALAHNHDLICVDNFVAHYHFLPWKSKMIKMRGFFEADIVQRCVISLVPIETKIHQEIKLTFIPDGAKLLKNNYSHIDASGELFLDVEGPDAPEVYKDHVIEVGAITEELFELALDPYPRHKGAKFQQYFESSKVTENLPKEKVSPFSVLHKLKNNKT